MQIITHFQKKKEPENKSIRIKRYPFQLMQLIEDEYTSLYHFSKDSNIPYHTLRLARIKGSITVDLLKKLEEYLKKDLKKYIK